MKMILAIAAGGALGAVARHLAVHRVALLLGAGFPWGTLAVNVVGSFAMGLLIEISALVWQPPGEVRAFLAVGFLGAFTTFSTFALDVAVLYERGQLAATAGYIAGSVTLSVAALFAGMTLVRAFSA